LPGIGSEIKGSKTLPSRLNYRKDKNSNGLDQNHLPEKSQRMTKYSSSRQEIFIDYQNILN